MYDPEQTPAVVEHVLELFFHLVLWDYEFVYKETEMEIWWDWRKKKSLWRFKSRYIEVVVFFFLFLK